MKTKLSVTFDDDIVVAIDEIRGLAGRSAVINDLLKRKLAEGEFK
jgi:hypothetical protein